MNEDDLKHLEFFKYSAKKMKACCELYSESQLIAGRMMFEVSKVIEANFENYMVEEGLIGGCWPILMMAYASDEYSISATEINQAFVKNKSTTSRMIDSLIDKGFMERKGNDSDRRKIELILTAKGKDYVQSIFPKSALFTQSLFEGVDVPALHKELIKVWANAQKLKTCVMKKTE